MLMAFPNQFSVVFVSILVISQRKPHPKLLSIWYWQSQKVQYHLEKVLEREKLGRTCYMEHEVEQEANILCENCVVHLCLT